MNADPQLLRLVQLVDAFNAMASGLPDIRLRGSTPTGFTVSYQPESCDVRAELTLWVDGARLCSWNDNANGYVTLNDRSLRLDLTGGFNWEDLVFPDAESMARALLQRLTNERIRTVGVGRTR